MNEFCVMNMLSCSWIITNISQTSFDDQRVLAVWRSYTAYRTAVKLLMKNMKWSQSRTHLKTIFRALLTKGMTY